MIKALANLREKILFRIARAGEFIFASVRGYETTRRRGRNAVVIRHQKTRQVTAA